jgi:hypothetical protein
MRNVIFDPNKLDDDRRTAWNKLSDRADLATTKVINEWEEWLNAWLNANSTQRAAMKFKPDLDSTIWRDIKEWMFANLFYKNCAYCETRTTRFYGDAEHHRPKGRVQAYDAQGKLTPAQCTVAVTGAEDLIDHPGYFWLAYNWRNLVPSCEKCNSGAGKVDKYPVQDSHVLMKRLQVKEVATLAGPAIESKRWPGYYYLDPADLDLIERPLLLNPLNPGTGRAPQSHLCFGVKGIIHAFEDSSIGKMTIEVLHLDDEDLTEDRKSAQEELQREYFSRLANSKNAEQEANEIRAPYLAGQKPYSVPALYSLKSLLDQIRFH